MQRVSPDASTAASTGAGSRPGDNDLEALHARCGDSAWSLACVMSAACDIRDRDVDAKLRTALATATAAQLTEMRMRRQRLPPPSHEDDAISPGTPPCGRSHNPTTPPLSPTTLPGHANQSGIMRPTLQSIKVKHRLAKLRRNSPTLIHHAPLLEMFERCCCAI